MNIIESDVDGLAKFEKYVNENQDTINSSLNEASTRFHIIDEVLICLGWKNNDFALEKHQNGDYTDYELGKPRRLIVEAKRNDNIFELPPNPSKNRILNLKSLINSSTACGDAINQAQKYCADRGVRYALVTNGYQYIAFLATRDDGISPLDGKALIFTSLHDIAENFTLFWNNLSSDAVIENRLSRTLNGTKQSLPKKLTSHLPYYPNYRTRSDLQASLKSLAELLIQDIFESELQEENFINYCYCESGTISKDSLLSKNILNARYASIFSSNESKLSVTDVRSKKGSSFDKDVLADAISKRPIVLLGDVGVGKSSFLKNLEYNSAFEEFRSAIFIKIDLGISATLTDNLKENILLKIENTLSEKYEINTQSQEFVSGVYSKEIQKFSQSIYGSFKNSDPARYENEKINMLIEKINNKAEHLKMSIKHASRQLKKQIIIIIDNADQRDFDTQQAAFLIAQELAKNWEALVFISVRPKTFFYSQRNGALSAYANKIFTIKPPRIDNVIKKRLLYAINIAKGDFTAEEFGRVLIRSESLVSFLSSLVYSLDENQELNEFISNITGGNVRLAIDIVKNFIGNPNVDVEKIISETERHGDYYIQLHEFSKSVLLSELSHFNDENSISMNIFDVSHPDPKEHFLKAFIISFLSYEGAQKDKDGFIENIHIHQEMQELGYLPSQIDQTITLLVNKKLIESNKRITFSEDDQSLLERENITYRVTSAGLYHVNRWAASFVYMDAVCYDTPIFDATTFKMLLTKVESNIITDRNNRAIAFKKYLLDTWHKYCHPTEYYDFVTNLTIGEDTFRFVANACSAIEKDHIKTS